MCKKQAGGLQEADNNLCKFRIRSTFMGQGARDASESWEDLDLPSSRRWPETTMYKGIEAGEVLLRHLPNTSLASSRHP